MDPPALQEYLPFVRLLGTGEDLDQGALAGAVVADEGDYLVGVYLEITAAQGFDVPVALEDATCLQQGIGHSLSG